MIMNRINIGNMSRKKLQNTLYAIYVMCIFLQLTSASIFCKIIPWEQSVSLEQSDVSSRVRRRQHEEVPLYD